MKQIGKQSIVLAAATCTAMLACPALAADEGPVGYTDTPYLSGDKWRVHDANRPHPHVITPAGGVFAAPPGDAVVLFDGTDLANWQDADGSEPKWILEDGSMRPPAPGTYDSGKSVSTRQAFGDIQLHIEWRTPVEPRSASQGRGNSGVILMGLYEIQILDSFENVTYADGQAGAMYGYKPPLVNATLPPGEWQSYDIVFEAPRFSGTGLLESPAFVTVIHNGALLHHREAYPGPTQHRKTTSYSAHAEKLPLTLQDHSNPVEFRNVWVRELDLTATD